MRTLIMQTNADIAYKSVTVTSLLLHQPQTQRMAAAPVKAVIAATSILRVGPCYCTPITEFTIPCADVACLLGSLHPHTGAPTSILRISWAGLEAMDDAHRGNDHGDDDDDPQNEGTAHPFASLALRGFGALQVGHPALHELNAARNLQEEEGQGAGGPRGRTVGKWAVDNGRVGPNKHAS